MASDEAQIEEKMKNTKSEWVVIRRSKIHGRGLFARKDIPEGTRIIEYVGNKLTKKQSDERDDTHLEEHRKNKSKGAVYTFILNKRYNIDGSVSWNTARLINHSCCPNCKYEIIRGHIWIISIRDIKKGEEITYNYGYNFDKNFRDHPCKCGAKYCIGYILDSDYWHKVDKALKKSKKK